MTCFERFCERRPFKAILAFLVSLALTGFHADSIQFAFFNVKDFGATGNGVTLDTKAINNAIKAASSRGGGTVVFPAGVYLSGSIRLVSNITLFLDEGCTILAAPNDIRPYDSAESNPYDAYQDFGHSHWHNSLIWGESLDHVAITGQGTIDGGGMTTDNQVPEGGGDKSIALKLCRDVDIKGVTIIRGGHFAILLTGCDNVMIENLEIDTNRDGIDIDACRNVHILACSVNSPHDDGICLKSSFALGYKRATQNVTIGDCIVSGYDEGSMVNGSFTGGGGCGRIKCGTESNGGFKNITISNCVFDRCCGLALEEVDGGEMDGVTVSNIVMRECSNSPIFIRLGDRARGPNNPPPGSLKNIAISSVLVIGSNPMLSSIIAGIPGSDIENVRLNDVNILVNGGGTKDQASIDPPEDVAGYPEASNFGTTPAYGFFCRHVKDIDFNNINLSSRMPDMRPGFVLDHVTAAEFHFITAQKASGGLPLLQVRRTQNLLIDNSLCIKSFHGNVNGKTWF